MIGELLGNVFHVVGLPLTTNQGVAEGTNCRDVAAKECQVLLEIDPGLILAGTFASKPVHGGGIVLDESDAVTQHQLKRSEGTLLAPLVEQFFGVVKAAEDDQSLPGKG